MKYKFNYNLNWQSEIMFKGKHIFTSYYNIEKNTNGKCIDKFNAAFFNPSTSNWVKYRVLSASEAKIEDTISMALFKTIGDLNLLLGSTIGGW